jgi:hypothetical protein
MTENEATQLPSIIDAVLAVEAVEGTLWIPDWLRSNTYFSQNDLWLFAAVVDDHTCFDCQIYDKMVYSGDELRSEFPYMEIIDETTILALVHPHCRCILTRIVSLLDSVQFDVYP